MEFLQFLTPNAILNIGIMELLDVFAVGRAENEQNRSLSISLTLNLNT